MRRFSTAALVFALFAFVLGACSTENTTTTPVAPATTAPPAPVVKKELDPQSAALKAKMEARKKNAAKADGERASIRLKGHAETMAAALAAKAAPPKEEVKAPTAGRPRTKSETFKATGRVKDTAGVKRVFASRGNQLQNCYERGLKKDPSLRGKVKLQVNIASSGKVAGVRVAGNTLGDKGVLNCMTRSVRGWTFPKPEGGGVTVAKTFVFTPQT